MFSFGEFYSLDADKVNYSVWELFLFIVLGAAGGLIGGYCTFSYRTSKWLPRPGKSMHGDVRRRGGGRQGMDTRL